MMRSTRLRSLKALAVVGFLACLDGMSDAAARTGIAPELKHSWEVSFNRGDAAAVAALYAPDAQLVMSGSDPIIGSSNIRAALESMIKSGVKARIGMDQNVGHGDVAYVYGSYSILSGDGGSEVERGKYVEVWRLIHGVWKIVVDINTRLPGPAASSAAST